MADTNPLQQAFFLQQSGITPDQYQKLMAAQQQEAMANALLQQGETPISTEGRSIGGVGYRVSPLEGLAKMAQILSGKDQQSTANAALANALAPQPGQQQSQQASDPIVAAMPPQTQSLFNRLSMPESMGGSPRAAIELYNTYAAGMKAYGSGTGTAAAGNAPVGTLPPGVGGRQPPTMGTQPPITPVQGPVPAQGAPVDPLTQYRNDNGMPAPPIDAQRQGMGLSVGSSIPMGNPPSMPASALNAPPQGGIPAPPPSATIPPVAAPAPVAAMPSPMAGETNDQFQGRLAAAKAGAIAQAEVAPKGAAMQAEDTGKNLADATKTFNVAASNLPRAMQRFSQLRDAAANASSGAGVSDQEPDQGILDHFLPGPDWARSAARMFPESSINPKVALANQTIDQATKQGVLTELGPQMQGLKGNKYLESIASGASGLNPADPAPAKINAINGLQDQYISNMKSLAQQRHQYGDAAAPSDMDLAKMISQNADPNVPVSVVDPQGRLGRVSPVHLPDLIQAGGQIR